VLDLNCKAHDLDNLYVVDGSFMVTSAAVNPTLTIIANTLRVGEHLLERLGARTAESASFAPTRLRSSTPAPAQLVMAKCSR
jgi:choline dehydrogenase-like flavoprotein